MKTQRDVSLKNQQLQILIKQHIYGVTRILHVGKFQTQTAIHTTPINEEFLFLNLRI